MPNSFRVILRLRISLGPYTFGSSPVFLLLFASRSSKIVDLVSGLHTAWTNCGKLVPDLLHIWDEEGEDERKDWMLMGQCAKEMSRVRKQERLRGGIS